MAPTQNAANVTLHRNYLNVKTADALLAELVGLDGWQQDHIRMFGKTHPIPRLHRWFATGQQPYRWSGITMTPEPFPASVGPLLKRMARDTDERFNTALGNLYRNGQDSVGWHADDEPELGPEPIIASLSLGATRTFLMRRRKDHRDRQSFDLEHGSLLVMAAGTQRDWEHCLPKRRRIKEARVNLTFRTISDG